MTLADFEKKFEDPCFQLRILDQLLYMPDLNKLDLEAASSVLARLLSERGERDRQVLRRLILFLHLCQKHNFSLSSSGSETALTNVATKQEPK